MSVASCSPTDIWGYPADWSNGQTVTIDKALSVPSVWAAVKKISETLASLPFDLYIKTDEGSVPAKDHPVRYLIRSEPSPYVSAYSFRQALIARACFGDAFARIHRNGIGRPVRFELMDGRVNVVQKEDGSVGYVWHWNKGGKTGVETLLPYEVIHIKGFSLSNVKGIDVTTAHRDTLGFAYGANQYGNAFFTNNASVDKVLTVQGQLKPDQRKQLADLIGNVSGARKTGSTMILDSGMDLKKVGLNPEEAMLNESRAFQVNETSRVFGVQSHLLENMDGATLDNIETMSTQFVTLTLRPWAVQFEQEYLLKTLTRDERESDKYFYRHNFEGLLRGDTATRSAFYASAIQNGYLTRNEVREKENFNTIEGLDNPLVPANLMMLDKNGDVIPYKQNNTPVIPQPGTGGKKQDNGTPQNASATGTK